MGCIKLEYLSESSLNLGNHLRLVKGNSDLSTTSLSLLQNQIVSCTQSYRYGFQGMEKDDEIKGNGNSYDFGARMQDPRVGRFLSLDAYADNFVAYSPYVFAGNTPIRAIDNNGDSVLFFSESNEYLGYSNDNQRYKGKNLLVIIDDNTVASFKEQYEIKRDCTPYSSQKAEEANVAGLEAMGTSFDVNDMFDFYSEFSSKRKTNDGKLRERKEGEYEVEFSAKLELDRSNPLDKGGSLAVDETSWLTSNSSTFVDMNTKRNKGVGGDFHTHVSDNANIGLKPSDSPDNPRARRNHSYNVIVSDDWFEVYKIYNPIDKKGQNMRERTILIQIRKEHFKEKGTK